jgi:hypothetical protein
MVGRGEVEDEADPNGEEAVYHTDRNDLLPQLLKSVGNVILINDTIKTTRKPGLHYTMVS